MHKDPELYTVFDLESCFIDASDLFDVSEPKRWWIRPSESKSWWTHEFEIKIDNMIRDVVELSNGGLKEIRVRHCSDHSLSLIAQRCPNLEVLSIKSSPNVTDESMLKVAFGCPKLKEVDISYCYGISHTSLLTLGRNCSNILILKRNHIGIYKNRFESAVMIENIPTNYLRTRPEDGDLVAATIGKFMPQLLHLELRFSQLSLESLDLICEGCTNLENLDISSWKYLGYKLIEKATLHLRNLKKLKSRMS